MTITQEQFVQLSRIYNTLLGVETKGENTLLLSDCIRAMQDTLQKIQDANQNTATQAAPADTETAEG